MRALVCMILAVASARPVVAQPVDSLDTVYDAESRLSESSMEPEPPPSAFSLTWRSGWTRDEDGHSHRHGLRARWTRGALHIRVAGDHDPGETLRTRPLPTGFDHLVASVQWRPAAWIDVVTGSYRRSWFLGLSAGDERFGSPVSDALASAREGRGVRPWAAAGEDSYLRGLAVSLRPASGLIVSFWTSSRGLDARLDSASARASPGGLHDTDTARAGRDAVRHREIGGAVVVETKSVSVGAVVVNEGFDMPFCPGLCGMSGIYRRAARAASFYGRLGTPRLWTAFECRLPSEACMLVATVSRARSGRLTLVARRILHRAGPHFAAPAVAQSSAESGERGVLLHARLPVAPGVRIELAADHATVAGPYVRRPGRSIRSDHRAVIHAARGNWSVRATLVKTVRTRTRSQSPDPGTRRQKSVRLQVRLGTRVMKPVGVWVGADWLGTPDPRAERSAAMHVGIDWRPSTRFRVRAGRTEYALADGATPLILYEPDTALAYPLRSLWGFGRRHHALIEWDMARTSVMLSVSRGRRLVRTVWEDAASKLSVSVSVRLVR